MIVKKINEEEFNNFVFTHEYSSFYQSVEWLHLKLKENKKCELLGLFENDELVGVSLVIYLKILRKYYMAYASRGFVYDYHDVESFKLALLDYFKDKKVVFFRMDPPVILAKYDKLLKREVVDEAEALIEKLKNSGFKHYGYNMAFETNQFRFVHRLVLESSFDKQFEMMGKSTKKNITMAQEMGVKIKKVGLDDLDDVFNLFEATVDRKHIEGFSKNFYENLVREFKDNVIMYIAYIDKEHYQNYLKTKLNDAKKSLEEVNLKMAHDNVGSKLKKQEEIAKNNIQKYNMELEESNLLNNYTNIASMLSIFKYKEAVSFVSGMNNKYRKFCPKYAMYPAMIVDAIAKNYEYVNFLGVKNIMNKNDDAYGIYEVKRGFGGETIEYIGEFDLPIKMWLYKLYKLKENKDRGK